MNPKVSVIVPVYNTGSILRGTLDSIINQTYKDFELILVDDGSKDESPKICDEYASKDLRIKVIHKANGGICDARNVGIAAAAGEYITFCDHDDLYMPDKLQVQIELAERYKADIVNVGYVTTNDDGKQDKTQLDIMCLTKDGVRENLYAIANGFLGTIWVKLYKRSTFGGLLHFNTKYTRGHEDINFNYKLMAKVNTFISTSQILYNHIIRGSLSTSAHVHKEAMAGMTDAILNYSGLLTSCKIDLSSNSHRKEYVVALADLVRTLCLYSVKANYSYREYSIILCDLEKQVPILKYLTYKNMSLAPAKDRIICTMVSTNKFLSYLLIRVRRIS